MDVEEQVTPLIRRRRVTRWIKRLAIVVTVLVVVAGVGLWWAFRTGQAAEFLRQEILVGLRDRCGVEAEFTDLKIDPLAGDFTLTDLIIEDRDGRPLLAVDAAEAALAFWPLLKGRLQLSRVALTAPEANLRFTEDGAMVGLPSCLEPAEGSSAPMNLGVSALTVDGGRFRLDVADLLSAQLEDIDVRVKSQFGGQMDVRVGVDDTELTLAGRRPLIVERFRLRARLEGLISRPRALLVQSVDVKVGPLNMHGDAKVDLIGPVYAGQLRVEGPMSAVKGFFPSAPSFSGAGVLDLGVTGSLIGRRIAGELRIRKGKVDDIKLGDRTTIAFVADEDGVVDLQEVVIEMGDGQLSVRGRVSIFDPFLSVRLDTRLKRQSLARTLDALGSEKVLGDFRATGRSVLKGTLNPVDIEGPLDFNIEDLVVGDRPWDHPDRLGKSASALPPEQRTLWVPQGRLKGRWRFTDESMTLTAIEVTAGATSGLASAFVPFAKEGALLMTVDFPEFDFADVGPIGGLPFAGRGRLEGTLEGVYEKIGASGSLRLTGAAVGPTPLGTLSSRVKWFDDRRLYFSSLDARIRKTKFRGSVNVDIDGEVPLDIYGDITDGRIQDLFYLLQGNPAEWGDAQGKMTANLHLQGPLTKLDGEVRGTLGEGQIYGERWQRGIYTGRFEEGRIVVESLELDKYAGRVLASGFVDPNRGNLRITARTRDLEVQSLDLIRASQERLTGKVFGSAQVGGSIDALTGTVAANFRKVKAGSVPLGSARWRGKLRGTTIEYSGEGLDGAAQLQGTMSLSDGLPYKAIIDLKNVNLPAIYDGLRGQRTWNGNVTLLADLNGRLVKWPRSSGLVKLEEARIESAEFAIGTSAPADLRLGRGTFGTERLLLSGPRSQLSIRGKLGPSLADLRVVGRIDLAVAELVNPSIEKSGGLLRLDASVQGTPASPRLLGTGSIEGGILKWLGIEDRVTGFSADLTFSQSSVLIGRSAGRFASGQIGVTGRVLLRRFLPRNINVTVFLTDVRPRIASRTIDLSGVLSGPLVISGPTERMEIRGTLDVVDGRAKPKIDWSSFVGARPMVAVYDPAREVVEYDILLRGKQPFRIRNQDVDVMLTGEFRLTGTNERIGMLGTMPLVQGGRVVFLGREYTFRSGTLNLTERYRFAPRYDFRLSSESCDAAIVVGLVGSLTTFKTTYQSKPEMDQRDIVSCLIRGVKISNLDQDLPSFAGSALLKLSGVDREVKKVLLIDQIEVTTEYSSLARAYEPRVLVAKNLSLLDRPARLEYSTSLLRPNDQRAAVRVRLTPQLNLQLGWTSSDDVPIGDVGLDLKQRWEW